MITLADAVAAAESAIEAAKVKGAIVAVAVCDENGRLKAFFKMDGAKEVLMGHEAMRRAIHSASIGAPSDDTSKSARGGIVEGEGIGGSSRPGGLPCFDGDGIVGSVGVAGADDDICVHCAKAGVAALSTGRR